MVRRCYLVLYQYDLGCDLRALRTRSDQQKALWEGELDRAAKNIFVCDAAYVMWLQKPGSETERDVSLQKRQQNNKQQQTD